MERTETYWKALIDSIKLIHGLAILYEQKNIQQEQKNIDIEMWLNQIQSKAEFKAGKFDKLGDELGISQEFTHQRTESESLDYWIGVGDAAGLAKNFIARKRENPSSNQDLNSFLSSVKSKAEAKLIHFESPLIKELGIEFGMQEGATSAIKDTPEPAVQPRYIPEPEPEPAVQPRYIPEPEPEPVVQPRYIPEPEPEPVVQPRYIPESEPEIITEPELEYSKDIDIESDETSLIGALLEADDSADEADEDILSSSLMDALKMLKDEDED